MYGGTGGARGRCRGDGAPAKERPVAASDGGLDTAQSRGATDPPQTVGSGRAFARDWVKGLSGLFRAFLCGCRALFLSAEALESLSLSATSANHQPGFSWERWGKFIP